MTDPALHQIPGDVPRAVSEPVPRRSYAWLLPVLAVALAVFLAVQAWGEGGTRVVVRAREGHGIEAGHRVRYRGIEVGSVAEVRLSRDLEQVELVVDLQEAAEDLARAGSRFWIVRPRLALDGVAGLETVVGARYLAVHPGPPAGRRQTEFVALEEPPVEELVEAGGLEVFLEAENRYGLSPGAPLTYRQLQIGTVLSVGLSSDATSVEARAYVRPPYVQLVRERTRFWETGGVEVGLSITGGLRLDMASLRSLFVGGVAIATPPDPGDVVATGHRFPLHPEPEEEWLEWSPPLPVGGSLSSSAAAPPELLRAALRWKQGRILKRTRERQGWVLPVEDGLLGPADLFTPAEEAQPGTVVLEVAGESYALEGAPAWTGGGLARVGIRVEDAPRFDLSAAREPGETVEECLVFADVHAPPMALAATRLSPSSRGWEVDGAVGFDPSWNGACVVAREDGALLGILLVDEEGARVAPLP